MSTIVVGASNSPQGRAALDAAVDYAKALDGQLLLVTYVPDPRSATSARRYAATQEEEAERLRSWGASAVPDGIAWDVEVDVSTHKAAQALVGTARRHNASLLVIGIQRRTPVGKLVLGSTAQDVLLNADCPVLAVKANETPAVPLAQTHEAIS